MQTGAIIVNERVCGVAPENINDSSNSRTETLSSAEIADRLGAINTKLNKIESGIFAVQCNAGANRINASTPLVGGNFPTTTPSNCIAMVINHSADDLTKDTIMADGQSFIIYSEKTQIISVKWMTI